MFSRAAPGMGVLVLALLASTTLLPLAASDHAYSHRYVVYGRVLDADNNPIPGLQVNFGVRDVETEGPCQNQPGTETDAFGRTENKPVTNPWGEFMFCEHVHSMSRAIPGTGILVIPALDNLTREIELDPYYRVSFIPVTLADVHPDANPQAVEGNYTVVGRLWREGNAQTHVEGIRVFGETVDNTPVNVTLEIPGQEPIRANTTTNNYGDFSIRVPMPARPTSGFVTIEAEGHSYREAIDPAVGTTTFKIEVPDEGFLSARTFYAIVGVLAAAAIIVGAVYAFRRASARREEAAVRSRSERRRANK